ncbi:recombinase family protein [Agrobacterium tumefaciens]|uniref:Recombinase n=1 Tax=Agrobacterium tumefaciens str. Kerr 14 TaxID=1183424 RepID=A0A1S7Q3U5_AGRTU|nr:recombinase family protein [Agrobacterium tumefaciens]AYM80355.1 hypothetical protein At12D1_04680 [Agrobacterium tumefaciens]NTE91055.1 recombinase family protein [Agrobacterium tumefaciens]CUX30635.1 Recombinase [Agrobacterium tumefaciens str. Kerr 14]
MTKPKNQNNENGKVRAAQYVRMSTDHQKYSTQNQADVIQKYADDNDIEIVKTYEDSGKSGLNLDGRDALQQLIDDVETGKAEYSLILVYDVSRWGRFQNADESAYLEYLCTRNGIGVEYCAEQFANDGSLTATIIKNMKRAMAGEYSRDLSRKVFEGQKRLILLGYRQGGMAGFGLRRQLIDEKGDWKTCLAIGERKSLQTDRVILVPGPGEEVAIIRRMYDLFVVRGLNEGEIANILNRDHIVTDLGRPWTRGTVHQVLTNEKYLGNNVFNRISFKLKRNRVKNAPDDIIRAIRAFEPIIDAERFEKAAKIIAGRSTRLSNDEMLRQLADLLARTGRLSALIIDECGDMASSSAYGNRFGSLIQAYELVGYTPERDYSYVRINQYLRTLYPGIINGIVCAIREGGGDIRQDPQTDLLHVNEEMTVSLVISRCDETASGNARWRIRFDAGLDPDLTIAIRMAPGNQTIQDYYLLPRLGLAARHLKMSENNGLDLDAYRSETLERFFSLTARVPIRRAA